jgi:hypothetical protein
VARNSVCAIAKAQGCSVAQVNRVIDAWAEEAIGDQLRKRRLCLELERFDELMAVFYRRAVRDADVRPVFWSRNSIERRSVMLGLNEPAPMTLQILEGTTPKQTTTDRIEQAIAALVDSTKDRTTH